MDKLRVEGKETLVIGSGGQKVTMIIHFRELTLIFSKLGSDATEELRVTANPSFLRGERRALERTSIE
jgi:hypothetical protein